VRDPQHLRDQVAEALARHAIFAEKAVATPAGGSSARPARPSARSASSAGQRARLRVRGFTVPAINIRTLTSTSRAPRCGPRRRTPAVVFEIARSEIRYRSGPPEHAAVTPPRSATTASRSSARATTSG
jgi:hypothetical protein